MIITTDFVLGMIVGFALTIFIIGVVICTAAYK